MRSVTYQPGITAVAHVHTIRSGSPLKQRKHKLYDHTVRYVKTAPLLNRRSAVCDVMWPAANTLATRYLLRALHTPNDIYIACWFDDNIQARKVCQSWVLVFEKAVRTYLVHVITCHDLHHQNCRSPWLCCQLILRHNKHMYVNILSLIVSYMPSWQQAADSKSAPQNVRLTVHANGLTASVWLGQTCFLLEDRPDLS